MLTVPVDDPRYQREKAEDYERTKQPPVHPTLLLRSLRAGLDTGLA